MAVHFPTVSPPVEVLVRAKWWVSRHDLSEKVTECHMTHKDKSTRVERRRRKTHVFKRFLRGIGKNASFVEGHVCHEFVVSLDSTFYVKAVWCQVHSCFPNVTFHVCDMH